MEKPIRKYEAVIILHPDLNEEGQKTFFRKNRDIINSFSGHVNHIDLWGKRRLANPINKLAMGTYFHTTFEAKAECILELERTMKLNDKVIRFQHSRLDDRKTLDQHLEAYYDVLKATKQREQEREAKAQARRNAPRR